jgi:DNA-binding winged helix-turn-helix (wHTH) protein/TolB-like protein/tetratricopeptide (TPR) repeat protein
VRSAIPNNGNVYSFDDIVVDGEIFRVRKNGQIVNLTPRAFDVLTFLVRNGGRTVEKQEIFESVWKDVFVSDNALTKIIKELRHALEDSPNAPRYIETVPKRGYRFIGEIRENHGQTASETEILDVAQTIAEKGAPDLKAQPAARKIKASRFALSKTPRVFSAAVLIIILGFTAWLLLRPKPSDSAAPIRLIAVLPFKPLDTGSRDESLEMGMAETLITRLSSINQLIVRPMSAVRKYTDVNQDPLKAGQEIQAEAVLDGSIQRAGERVRVTVRLTDVRNGTTLWSEQFDENFTDIFRVQDSIAERIANALTLRLSRQEKERLAKHSTDNPEAYQLYLRGQLLWHGRRQNWIEQSLAYYREALEKDPGFALAHIGTADCYIMLSGHHKISMREAELKARPAIMRALEIDNNLAQAHNALAELKYQYEYDWRGAEKEFKKAIELNPNIAWIRQAYGWFLMSEARFQEATAEMEKAQQLDPSSLTVNVGRGRLYFYSRQYDQAIRHFQNIIAIEPNDRSLYLALYNIYEQKKMYAEAVDAFLKFQEMGGMPPAESEEYRKTFSLSGWQGFARRQLEQMEKQKVMGFSESTVSFANVNVRLSNKDEAFAWLEKVFETREPSILQFKIEPLYDSLRNDPRYAELLRKIGQQP